MTHLEDESDEELYVVQISIIESKEKSLFRTSGGSVYLKKGTSCTKMNSAEITKEIEIRSQIYLSSEANKLDQKLVLQPDDYILLEERARIAKFMGNIDEMDKHYQKLLKLDPGNSRVIKKYADAHKTVGDLEGALSILNEAIKSNNSDSLILKSKASILLDSDRLNEAYQSYQQALILYPDDYIIITQIGIALRRLSKYDESIRFLNYALAKSPSYRRAKYEKKITYYEMFKGGL